MESERLYINNKLIELSTQTQQFARTLQEWYIKFGW
jgi:hypothetical protein